MGLDSLPALLEDRPVQEVLILYEDGTTKRIRMTGTCTDGITSQGLRFSGNVYPLGPQQRHLLQLLWDGKSVSREEIARELQILNDNSLRSIIHRLRAQLGAIRYPRAIRCQGDFYTLS